MIRKRRSIYILTFALISWADSVLALRWTEFHAERHDRFYQEDSPARAFIGEEMDWSGVGIWQYGWGTMISDSYFLTSFHIRWPNGQADPFPLQFYRKNNLDSGSSTNLASINIDTSFGVRIENTDLYVGRLTQPVPGWVRKYPLIKRNDQTNWLSYLDTTVWIYGRAGDASLDPAYAKSRVGKNRIHSAFGQATIQGMVGTVLKWSTRPDEGSYGIDEVGTISGDSSGPSFVASPYSGGLALAGIHTGYDTDTSIAAYLAQIKAAVPEPVSIATDQFADLNGDFKVNGADLSILAGNFGSMANSTYNQGDLNSDGKVNNIDLIMMAKHLGADVLAPTDFNKDGGVDAADLKLIGANWLRTSATRSQGDADRDGVVDQNDIAILNANWRFDIDRSRPYPAEGSPADFNGDRLVDDTDLAVLSAYFGRTCNACASDLNRDGRVDSADLLIFAGYYTPYRPGDINLDRVVNNADMSILLSNWGRTSVTPAQGDINRDGVVDARDFSIVADWWGWGTTSISGAPAVNVVPEPAAIASLFSAATLVALASRRRP